jgi:DNA invertase Pin-like site-specific DNA recombinase
MKVALYARVSTVEQDATQQLKDCETVMPGVFKQVFIENQSAWKDNKDRPQFDKVMKLIKNRQIDHLIVWDWDRLYRNRLKLVDLFRFCKACGCIIHSFRQGWAEEILKAPAPWNEIMFDFLLNVMGYVGEEESTKKSDRVKKAIKRDTGQTLSYKGNKWGRKGVNHAKLEKIRELMSSKRNLSIRFIAKEVGLGVGTVHKYINEIQDKIDAEKHSSLMVQLANTTDGEHHRKVVIDAFERAFTSEGWVQALSQSEVFNRKRPPLNSEKKGDEGDSTDVRQSEEVL